MKLNHLHLKTTNAPATCKFYQDYFGFRVAFGEDTLRFLVDKSGFLLAIGEFEPHEPKVTFPDWFHFGFCQDNPKVVEQLFELMKKNDVKFASELRSEEGEWADFKCLDPGGYTVEVSWHKADVEQAPELIGSDKAQL